VGVRTEISAWYKGAANSRGIKINVKGENGHSIAERFDL